MVTKKGIVITIIILVGITLASFSIWLIPQHENSGFVISDYRNELESIKDRHNVIINEIDMDWKNMLDGSLSTDDFIVRDQTSSSQINLLLSEIIESKAPQEWRDSYLNYGKGLEKYNDYLTEAAGVAGKLKGGATANDLKEEIQKMDDLKKESEAYTIKANETKP